MRRLPHGGSNDGMSITILQRMEDGSIKNHNEEAQSDGDNEATTGMAETSTPEAIATASDGEL